MSLNGRDVRQHGEVKSRFSHGGDTAFTQITERPLNFGSLSSRINGTGVR